MSQQEDVSFGQVTADAYIGGGINPFVRRIVYLDATNGSDGQNGRGIKIDRGLKTLAAAKAQIATNKNDMIVLVQGTSALNLAADPGWALNMCRLVGNAPSNYAGMRSRIGMSAAYTPMLTINGYGNLFENIYFQHGYGSGHVGHQGILVSGNYNTFHRVHISSPLETGIVAATDYEGGMSVTGTGFQYFKDCTFGNLSIERSGANPNITLGTGTCTMFEDCTFLARISATAPYFVQIQNTSGLGQAIFKRCHFLCMSTNMATKMGVAFTFTGGTTFQVSLDQLCTFQNVSELAVSASMGYIWTPTVFAATADELNLIAINSATY